ncbi:MAG TPA: ParB/RepB/Spo0J family partition protein [Acidobacteriota bacterium]|nr:ParB/RepB/Spo0J family partition protein [Acidobacteriota bacterium]HNB71366.1 ParB/RepB/Spo0J family partition protein [Acidobacteriota bacterium]HNG92574.1 ParB/RepB/Spo0J family partition protein [Acidobacteriota bacterium]HNJ41081.1 ParB/RepB/Spo0J family partition protein [Acidobacteriota bacterium]
MTRKALGRGLSALLPANSYQGDDFLEIDIDRISPNAQQPRTTFREESLEELAQSIRANGVVQPILVRKHGLGYELVAGERRWRAAQRAGLHKIPAVVKDVPDEKLLELALIENIQREELNPIEEANAYQRLIQDFKLRQEDIARQVGKERSSIANMLRLLRLSPDVQQLVEDSRISMGHARAILSLEDETLQRQVAEDIIAKGLSVRETERIVRRLIDGPPQPTAQPKEADPNLKAAETKLQRTLNTKVRITTGAKGGRIEIDYYSDEDLDRIYHQLMGNHPLDVSE